MKNIKLKPNIVIISLDAVRAQNLPFYGYHRNTTPFLTSVEQDLFIYENAISSSYWTMPSIASLFTGMYTSGHRLVVDGDKIDSSLCLLPELLQKHGYRSAGFVRNVYVSEYSGLHRGFNNFYSEFLLDKLKAAASLVSKNGVSRLQPPGITRLSNQTSNNSAIKKYFSQIAARSVDILMDSGSRTFVRNFSSWLDDYKTEPFFAFFHFLETHSPYRAPLKFAFKFLSLRDQLKKFNINHNHLDYLLGRSSMTAEDFQLLQSAYDNAIHYADYLIKKIFRLLQEQGVYDNTLIIILSDHGDNIGDHGLMFHYFCLYDTLIKIPLIVKYPRHIGLTGRKAEVAQNVDIFPTILSILDVQDKKPWEQIQGNDLLGKAPLKREKNLAISELVKAFGPEREHFKEQLIRYNRRLLSVRTTDRKFIFSSEGDHECFDLASDPAEINNLYPDNARFLDLMEKASMFYDKMNDFYISNKNKIDGGINPELLDRSVIEQLKSLGYM